MSAEPNLEEQRTAKQVAAAIVFHDGQILVARRATGQHLGGYWEFPGGKLEAEETAQHCIVRELAEELSLAVSPGAIVTESLHVYPGGPINLIAVYAEVASREVILTVHDEIRWLNPCHLLSVELAPADIPIAEELALRFSERSTKTGEGV